MAILVLDKQELHFRSIVKLLSRTQQGVSVRAADIRASRVCSSGFLAPGTNLETGHSWYSMVYKCCPLCLEDIIFWKWLISLRTISLASINFASMVVVLLNIFAFCDVVCLPADSNIVWSNGSGCGGMARECQFVVHNNNTTPTHTLFQWQIDLTRYAYSHLLFWYSTILFRRFPRVLNSILLFPILVC